MKKIIALIVVIAVGITFYACSKQEENDLTEAQPSTALTTTTEPATSTTAPVNENSEKGDKLKNAVLKGIDESSNGSITGDLSKGSFKYIYSRNPSAVYANERSEEFEKKATDNADKLVQSIKALYGDEITFDRMYPAQIGTGDNGIDSVRYEFYYLNTQNQQLKIYADSDGMISYAECNFTW